MPVQKLRKRKTTQSLVLSVSAFDHLRFCNDLVAFASASLTAVNLGLTQKALGLMSWSSQQVTAKLIPNYVQKCMQWRKWRNWRKIASLWRFELDAKSGPLDAGDFGEIGDFGKNRQRAGDNSDKRPRPLETGNFGERNACNGEKWPASGDLNWMPFFLHIGDFGD